MTANERVADGPDVIFNDEDVDGLIVILDTVWAHPAPELTVAS